MPVPHPLPDRAAALRGGGSGPDRRARRRRPSGRLSLCLHHHGCWPAAPASGAGGPSPPVLIASERGEIGLAAGMALLRAGASAMDAVEAAIRIVEANEADHYVGVGGLPNLLGEVELDASIMDGATRRSGAVAAVTGFPHPISIARAVFDLLPQHVLLVGRGAERFADEVGIERGETLTDEALKMWQERLTAAGLAPAHEAPVPGSVSYSREALEAIQSTALRDGAWGTVNVLALDSAGS